MQPSIEHTGHFPDGVFASMPTDRVAIDQAKLDIREKTRSASLQWQGQFSPQLIDAILDHYPRAKRIADPFVGSGTLLHEVSRRGLHGIGVEVNPAAHLLSRFYELVSTHSDARRKLLTQISGLLDGVQAPYSASHTQNPHTDWHNNLVQVWQSAERGTGKEIFLGTLLVLLDAGNGLEAKKRLPKVFKQLSSLLEELPIQAQNTISAVLGDARSLGSVASNIDLVVTSPPYINVYNYHQKYRRSVEAMGWKPLKSARSEIGSNRKHRGNRVLTVIQYCLDMADVLLETRRVLKPKGTAVFVVGRESRVRKTPFYNGEIIAEIAVRACALSLELKQERVFRNRFGQDIYEDILHFRRRTGERVASRAAIERMVLGVAEEVLQSTLDSCPDESRADVAQALSSLESVTRSPLLEPEFTA